MRVCVYSVCTNSYDLTFLSTLLPASPLAVHILFVDKVSFNSIIRQNIFIHPSYEIACIAPHFFEDYLIRLDLAELLGRVPLDRICKFLPMAFRPDYDIYLYHDLRVTISESAFDYSIRELSACYDRVAIPHRKYHSLKGELSHCLARSMIRPAQLNPYLSLLRCLSALKPFSLPVTENGFFAFRNNSVNFQCSTLILRWMSLSSVHRDQLIVPLVYVCLPLSISIYPHAYNENLGCSLAYRSQSIPILYRLSDLILNLLRTQSWSCVISLIILYRSSLK